MEFINIFLYYYLLNVHRYANNSYCVSTYDKGFALVAPIDAWCLLEPVK